MSTTSSWLYEETGDVEERLTDDLTLELLNPNVKTVLFSRQENIVLRVLLTKSENFRIEIRMVEQENSRL